jgi:hypothetical protein
MGEAAGLNRLMRLAEWAGLEPDYAAGNYARRMENIKNDAALLSQSKHMPTWARYALTGVAIAASGLMLAFYGEKGRDWLGLKEVKETRQLSWLGRLVTGFGIWEASDAQNNATNILNLLGTTLGMISRAKGVRDTKAASVASYAAMGTGVAMAGIEAGLADKLYENVSRTLKAAANGVAAGGGLPDLQFA